MTEWLKEKRVSKGYTQESLANKAGIAKTTYASYEQGQRNPSIENAKVLGSLLDIPWTLFFADRVREKSSEFKQEVS